MCVCVCLHVVGSIVNKFTSASHKLFPVRHDNHYAYLCHRAWPSRQNEDGARIGMHCQNSSHVTFSVLNSGVQLFMLMLVQRKSVHCVLLCNLF